MSQINELDNAHKAELHKEKDEVSRLKTELGKAQRQKSEACKLREDDAKKHKALLEKSESRANSAQKELEALKAKAESWLTRLTAINGEMSSKFPDRKSVV